MATYTVLGVENVGYRRFASYEEARELSGAEEAKGRRVEIVETCQTPGRRYGSQWTVYRTPEHVNAS
jgi:anaerobic ribonucleoside-triphosphate reductase